jgi:hypothetical protein
VGLDVVFVRDVGDVVGDFVDSVFVVDVFVVTGFFKLI